MSVFRKEPLLVPVIGLAVAGFAALGGWFLQVPSTKEQLGYRGTGMEQVTNKGTAKAAAAANVLPEAQPALTPEEINGPKASTVYQNVKVLGHLSEAQFNRVMVAITEWVSPEQGCAYCHGDSGNFAADDNYAKIVSRRMLEMTYHINESWSNHVGETGVTCYTCHRGNPVPQNIWFEEPRNKHATRALGNDNGQNRAGVEVAAYSSLPYDPLTPFIEKDAQIRVIGTEALPHGNRQSIKQTEWTYSLMMHMSESLGVNCTFCHNTRSFSQWDQSRGPRTSAYHGIRMARDLNTAFLTPLKPVYPENRLGPLGDAPKANCTTCHQGVNKPLAGQSMLKDYPELAKSK
ncbi:MAG: photosynthetic reaction center cytochrome PufC [Hyphomicrobiaceae bacterium]|nr:photosynthetic reaction center cytochrome PufC [Hyphomicrobiaceae bacterium]